jgi:4-hydroxy-tetrahydrodipicolinate reductase
MLALMQSVPWIIHYGVGTYGLNDASILIAKGWPIVAAPNRPGPKVGQNLVQR